MTEDEFLKNLRERFERGEISEETYRSIRKRYEAKGAEGETERDKEGQQEVDMAGSTIFSGNLVTGVFRCSGAGAVRGSLKAEEVRVSGSCDFSGPVEAETFRVSGAAKVAGDVKAQSFRTAGSISVDGRMVADELSCSGSTKCGQGIQIQQEGEISGSLRCGGDLTAQQLEIDGSFHVEGEIRAHDVKLEIHGKCRASAITGHKIEVRRGRWVLRPKGNLTVDLVEGQEVYLENTTAKRVKGQDVVLGPECHVDVLEAEEAVVHETSRVGERIQTGEA